MAVGDAYVFPGFLTPVPVIWRYLTLCNLEVRYFLSSGGTLFPIIWRNVTPCYVEVRYSLSSECTLLSVIWRYVTPCHLVGCRLVVLGFNATLTAKVISWRSVTHMCFMAFLHQSLSSGGTLLSVIWRYVTSCHLEVPYSLSSGGTLLPVIWRYVTLCHLEVPYSLFFGGTFLPVI